MMKKFLLAIVGIVAIIEQAKAENFIDALGAECGRLLFRMNESEYPLLYTVIIKRNTQFDALEKCLSLYKQNGGDMQELNRRYSNARVVASCAYIDCLVKETDDDKKCNNMKAGAFDAAVKTSGCDLYWTLGNVYPNCGVIQKWKTVCEKQAEDVVKEINKNVSNPS